MLSRAVRRVLAVQSAVAAGVVRRGVASASASAPASASGRSWLLAAAVGGGATVLGFAVAMRPQQDDEAAVEVAARPRNLLICGAPGSGKGTAAARLVEDFGVIHVSSGDLLRAEVKAGTPAGLKAKKFMDAGQLVPQEVFFEILRNRLEMPDCKRHGWLLDGYPRAKDQVAMMNEHGLVPDKVIILTVADSVAIARMCGRRTDPVTGAIYHMVFNPPPNDPVILKRLEQRSDDTEDKAVVRLNVYHKHMDDIVNWYPASKQIIVDATGSAEDVYAAVKKGLLH